MIKTWMPQTPVHGAGTGLREGSERRVACTERLEKNRRQKKKHVYLGDN